MGVFDRFFRIGDQVINTAMITHVELQAQSWDSDDTIVQITLISVNNDSGSSQSETLQFDGDQAEALRWIFSDECHKPLTELTGLYLAFRDLQQAIAEEDEA